MAKRSSEQETTEEIVLNEDQLICILTNKIAKATEKERNLQYMIQMMSEEYGFDMADLQRDFQIAFENDEGKKRRVKIDLAVFENGREHDQANLIRAVVVAKDSKVKTNDAKAGVHVVLDDILSYTDCDFGCWTNGEDLAFVSKTEDAFGQVEIEDISDFPAAGQTLEDLEKAGDHAMPRKPANESLVKAFKRCHDYIYGNEGMKKTAFWELLNLIFCKLYDEKRRFTDAREGKSYRRQFWVGVKEQNTPEGQNRRG